MKSRINVLKWAILAVAVIAFAAVLAGCSGRTMTIEITEDMMPYFLTNQCTASYDAEASGVKLECYSAAGDPFAFFDLRSYSQIYKKEINCNKFPFVLVKFRCDNCSSSEFTLFYTTDKYTDYQSKTVSFNNLDGKWQYICFDMRESLWDGKLTTLRFDFERTAEYEGEGITISAIVFAQSERTMKKYCNPEEGSLPPGLTAAELKESKAFLSSVKDNAPKVENMLPRADAEDSKLKLWFEHTYVKVPQETTKSNGMYTYTMRLAKNEIETVQAIISSDIDREGLTAKLSDFKNADGDVLRSELFYGYYFDDVDGETIADPIPKLKDAFEIKANTSKMILIKVYSEKETKAGMYSATFSIYDIAGREIKRANVYAYIWNFELPDETSCKTLMDLGWYGIYAATEKYEGDDSLTYKRYYDYLLENRVCAYTLPYDTQGTFTDPRIDEYLDNPRVVAFQAIGWKTQLTYGTGSTSYMYLSQKPEWLAKSYFYPIDEPATKQDLDKVNYYGDILKETFPGYKMIIPMHVNTALSKDADVDFFEYVKDSVNAWCPHTFFFSSYDNFKADPRLTYRCSAKIESKLGTFTERMEKEQNEGDEIWWYVTRFPQNPEITLTINTPSVNYRTLFWQQKLYNVDGFLYYLVNDWYGFQEWDKKHEVDASYPYNVYGNGVLLYWGSFVGEEGAVGCMRLEGVRDGIEDFEYFTMLDKLYGEGASDLVIKRWTTSLGEYSTDVNLFTDLRIAVGNLIEAAANK